MLKGAVIGTGFWANFQLAAWRELAGVEIVALYNRTPGKAVEMGGKFGISRIYSSVEALFREERPDFVDIITDVDTHASFTRQAAENGIDVICQKPMASSLALAREMVETCRKHRVRFFIHENFRWQTPVRKVRSLLDSNVIGTPFKARVSFCSAFPVFENQPFLKQLEHFIITDVGSHTLDVCRFLFGEAANLTCLTRKINPGIRGEDVADILMEMQNGMHCFVEMSYASILERESFPQALILIEGTAGSIRLAHDFEIKVTTKAGTETLTVSPEMYEWADPDYAVVHSSIVDCNRDILNGLTGGAAETTGEDNLETVKLVWGAYKSAKTGEKVHF